MTTKNNATGTCVANVWFCRESVTICFCTDNEDTTVFA